MARWLRTWATVVCLVLPVAALVTLGAGCERPLPEKHRVAPEQTYRLTTPGSAGQRVLVVHSYSPDFSWAQDINGGVLEALRGSGVAVDVFYMNTKRRPNQDQMRRAGQLASERIRQSEPDLVISCDDNAQEFVTRSLVGTSIPVVFCGVNADPTKYGVPAPNVTGVLERPHFAETLLALREIVPVERLAVLSSHDPTSLATISHLQEQEAGLEGVEVVDYRLVKTFGEWREAVLLLQGRADALAVDLYHTLESDTPGQIVDSSAVMDWTRRNCMLPTMGFYDFSVREGLLVSVAQSGREHGVRAGAYALEILKGRPMDQLPIVHAQVGTLMVNVQTAELLGLSLPPEFAARATQIGVP